MAMTTNEIDCLLRRILAPNSTLYSHPTSEFIGVFPAEKIPLPYLNENHPSFPHSSLIFSSNVNHLQHDNSICFVLNTDPSTQKGTHWTACYVTYSPHVAEPQVEFFDSYGLPPSVYNFNLPSTTISNSICLQADTSSVCGAYCILFLALRNSPRTRVFPHHNMLTCSLESVCKYLQKLSPSCTTRDKQVYTFVNNLNIKFPCHSSQSSNSHCPYPMSCCSKK